MITNLIQFFLFLCLSMPLHAMLDYSKEKADVQRMLNNNNEKLISWEKNNYSSSVRPIIEPLPPLPFNRSQIIANHVESLLNDENIKENFPENFINTVMRKKNHSSFLSNIVATPFYPTIISQLKHAPLKNNDPLIPDLNYTLAELYYHRGEFFNREKDYKRAYDLYKKNDTSYLTTKNAHLHALTSYFMISDNFDKQDIPHVYNLFGNIYTHLQSFTQTNPMLSYKIGLFIQTLLDSNPIIDASKKESLILNALEHLAYAEKSNICDTQAAMIQQMYAKFHYELSMLYKNQKNTAAFLQHIEQTCNYVDQLTSLSTRNLWLKAQTYNAAQKKLSDTELESILKLFINHKKPSAQQQEIILNLLPSCAEFFIKTNNHPLALKLINKITGIQNSLTHPMIWLTYYITKYLNDINDPYAKQWQKELNESLFYKKIQDPSHYNAETNAKIGNLLYQKEMHDYQTMIPYFIAAIDSNELSKETCTEMKALCALYYRNWAIQKHHDHQAALDLFDKAMAYDNTDQSCYKKAVFILENCSDQHLINHAIELLENNIQHNRSTKILSQFQLAQTYLHYHENSKRIPILKQYVPLNINKAITYLKAHENDKTLLIILCSILMGESRYIDPQIAEQYTDFKEALEIINLLIDLNGKSVEYITQRLYIYEKLNKPQETLNDINYLLVNSLLTIQDLPTSKTKEELCQRKLELLLTDNPDDNAYHQALDCLKFLQSYHEESCIIFNDLPIVQKHTHYFIENNIMTDYAIEWCHFAALSEIAHKVMTAEEQKNLAHYLLSAANMGNIYAQLIVLPYCAIVDTIFDDVTNRYQVYDHAHTALCNYPDKTDILSAKNLLIPTLKTYTERGVALAYYILCDYYKDDRKQLENTILLFNKAHTQYHYFDNTINTIEKIADSCQDKLLMYIGSFIANPEKGSLIDALATFTLGSMYLYGNNQNILTAGVYYTDTAAVQLSRKFKLSYHLKSIEKLVGNAYYKNALLEEKRTGVIDYQFLRNSALVGHLPAIHKMAELYIQQLTTGNTPFSINKDDFFPLLQQNAQNNTQSLDLFEKCLRLETKHTQQNPTKKVKSQHNDPEKDALITVVQNMEKRGAIDLSKNAKLALQHTLQSGQSTDIFPKSFNTKKQPADTKEESVNTAEKLLDTKELMRNKRALLQRKTKK